MNRPTEEFANLPAARQFQTGQELVEYDPYANQFVPDDEIDLRGLWRIIFKYKGTIFGVLMLVLLTSIVATLLLRPVYRAQALLEIKPDGGRVVMFQNLEQANSKPQEYKTTQQNILRSDSVAEAVISRLKLADTPEMSGKLTQRGVMNGVRQIVNPLLRKLRGDDQGNDLPATEGSVNHSVMKRFKTRLSVYPVNRSDLVRISFDSFDPVLAANVANTVIEEYMRLNQERRFGSTSGAKEYLKLELAKVQAKLEASEKDLTEFARENEIIDVEEKDDIMTKRLNDLNAQLTAVNGERVEAEAEYLQTKSKNGIDVLPAVLQDVFIQSLKSKQAELQAEYLRLSEIYKPAYPQLVQIQAELDRVNASLGAETNKIVSGIRANYEQLLNREKLLGASLEQQKSDLLALKGRSIQYNILKREWETNKQLYTGLLERMKEVGVAAGMEIDNILLIDRAKVPNQKHKPNIKLNILVASVIGLAAGICLAFLLAYLDNTVRNPEQLERVTGVSSLGVVPKTDIRKQKSKRSKPARKLKMDDLGLVSHLNRENEVSEAFRSIRTSLMFSSPTGLPKVLQVTSTVSGEGKTTVASNLAIVLADNGADVVIVDADLRKPRVHKVFGVPSAPGLTEILTEQFDKSPLLKTNIDRLSVLPSGTPPPNPAELLGSRSMDKIIDSLAKNHDHVIIDSAPLLGLADSVVVSTKVGGLVYVVHAGSINRDSLREGVMRLRKVRAPVLGAILNQVELGNFEYGDYYGGNYFNYESNLPHSEEPYLDTANGKT